MAGAELRDWLRLPLDRSTERSIVRTFQIPTAYLSIQHIEILIKNYSIQSHDDKHRNFYLYLFVVPVTSVLASWLFGM